MGAGGDGGGSSGKSGDGGSEDGTGDAGRGGGGRTADVMFGGGVKFADDRSADGAERVAARVAAEGARKGVQHMLQGWDCLLYTSPSPRDEVLSRMPSSA